VVRKLVGKRIQQYRLAKGLTQEQLAEELNLSRNFLSCVERGVYGLPVDKLVDIINYLGCSADEIFVDVIDKGVITKASILSERISELPVEEQERILDIIDALVVSAKKK